MSYYSILPSNRVGSRSVTGQGQNPDPMRPKQTPVGGFRTRDLNPNELASTRLAAIEDMDGPLMQRAGNRGRAGASARGLINSSLASGAAQGAVLDAATPLAMQEAGAYTNVGDRNMDAENSYLHDQGTWANAKDLEQMGNSTQLTIAGQAAEDRRNEFNKTFDEDSRRYDVNYQRQQADDALANRRNRENFIQSGVFNTVMSDPNVWGDPEGAMGFADYYMSNFGNSFDRLFPQPAP